jgi:HEAT repeat protein
MSSFHYRLPSPLEAARLTGDENKVVEALRHVKSETSRRSGRARQVLKILRETESPRVRNAAAIALADMNVTTAKDELIKLLSRDETKKSRGTLLYALEEMNAKIPIGLLAEIVANDRYEARAEALRFIADQRIQYNANELRHAIQKLQKALRSLSGEQEAAVLAALDYLTKRSIAKK